MKYEKPPDWCTIAHCGHPAIAWWRNKDASIVICSCAKHEAHYLLFEEAAFWRITYEEALTMYIHLQ